MPKSKKRTKHGREQGALAQPERVHPGMSRRLVSRRTGRTDSMSGLVIGAVVALGCWGIAYSFVSLNDPNRYVFAGMMAMIALLWSISFGVRLWKWQRRRQAN
ncbi:hypothetical protein [Dictyobacter arantiisoli]|uniref:Uncharacterized protein n=1 Tax=Dictyobacter arantiisoli TaxID=2014874 RepID=A0A5A5TF43_9CHLR|nr:hypothetical protein [Dictyobacter arantiisoli]GCF10191.1 hypothetical protein KDI_37550 [Dictyobacter arantiisoli]